MISPVSVIKLFDLLVVLVSTSISFVLLLKLTFPFVQTGKRKPQLILLDHGLYRELDFQTRTNYAALWKVQHCFPSKKFFHFCTSLLNEAAHLAVVLVFSCLLQALIFSDAKAIKENSVKLGAGEDLYALFAGILTMRPWNRVIDPAVDHLVIQGSDGDQSELQVSFCVKEKKRKKTCFRKTALYLINRLYLVVVNGICEYGC